MQFRVLDRREFIRLTAAAASGLGVGTGQLALAQGDQPWSCVSLSAWVIVHANDQIEIVAPLGDMGQGIYHSLPLIVAEELDADWSRVTIRTADADTVYANPRNRDQSQGSGNSLSVRGYYDVLREAGAAARAMLIAAAAERWGVKREECSTSDSTVTHMATGRQATYGDVAADAAQQPVPEDPPLKRRDQFTLLGTPQVRKDLPGKVTGTTCYGVDVRIPGMLSAAIRHGPKAGDMLAEFESPDAGAFPGLVAVVRADDRSIAAVAADYWTAQKAVAETEVSWHSVQPFDTSVFREELTDHLDDVAVPREKAGDVESALAGADKTLSARYSAPILAHATMEPMSCAADVRKGSCQVWAPSQNVERIRKRISAALDLDLEAVTIHQTRMGGAFGRRIEPDFVMQSVEISRAVSRPVRLIWSREEDIRNDYYRPPYVADYRGGLDANGGLVAIAARTCGPSIYDEREPGRYVDRADPTAAGGLIPDLYRPQNRLGELVVRRMTLRPGFWRSVASSMNGFFSESFVDEMALLAGTDPYEFRLGLVDHDRRATAVLEAAGRNWQRIPAEGRGCGIALGNSFGSYYAVSAEVTVTDGTLSIDRIRVAMDPGLAIDPDNIRAQIEGGVIFGLTAALFGEITVTNGQVDQSNFHDYRMLRLGETPPIEVELIESDAPPGGVGEVGTPLIAPALGNAIAAATGQRIRDLPFSRSGITLA